MLSEDPWQLGFCKVFSAGPRNTTAGISSASLISQHACVARARWLRKLFQPFREGVPVVADGNTTAAAFTDVILLEHKPCQVQKVLRNQAMGEALHGKKTTSILTGVTAGQMRSVSRSSPITANTKFDLICALPNIGASIWESMTLLFDPHDAPRT